MSRALLIGYGGIGAKRARILRDFGWTVTVWEPDVERQMAACADGFKDVQPLGRFPVMRDGPADVAFVCSPPRHHADHVAVCLEHGCHVFVEKPIAHSLTDAVKICKAAKESDRHVMVGCNYRFWDGIRISPERLERIEITMRYHLPTARPNWRDSYVNEPDQGGVVLDSGAHAIDLARYLAGPIKQIDETMAYRNDLDALVEDSATIHLTHHNGIKATIRLDWWMRHAAREVKFHTKTGHRWLSQLWDGTDGMFEREMRAFLRCVQHGTSAPPNGPEEATLTLQWCLEARDMVRGAIAVTP